MSEDAGQSPVAGPGSAVKETEYLLRNSNNAAALRQSIAEFERGTAPSENVLIPTLSGTRREAPGLSGTVLGM